MAAIAPFVPIIMGVTSGLSLISSLQQARQSERAANIAASIEKSKMDISNRMRLGSIIAGSAKSGLNFGSGSIRDFYSAQQKATDFGKSIIDFNLNQQKSRATALAQQSILGTAGDMASILGNIRE